MEPSAGETHYELLTKEEWCRRWQAVVAPPPPPPGTTAGNGAHGGGALRTTFSTVTRTVQQHHHYYSHHHHHDPSPSTPAGSSSPPSPPSCWVDGTPRVIVPGLGLPVLPLPLVVFPATGDIPPAADATATTDSPAVKPHGKRRESNRPQHRHSAPIPQNTEAPENFLPLRASEAAAVSPKSHNQDGAFMGARSLDAYKRGDTSLLLSRSLDHPFSSSSLHPRYIPEALATSWNSTSSMRERSSLLGTTGTSQMPSGAHHNHVSQRLQLRKPSLVLEDGQVVRSFSPSAPFVSSMWFCIHQAPATTAAATTARLTKSTTTTTTTRGELSADMDGLTSHSHHHHHNHHHHHHHRHQWHRSSCAVRKDVSRCSSNIVDSDLTGGNLILELTINEESMPGTFWSPLILREDYHWAALMASFTSRDDRLAFSEDNDFFQADLRPGDVFCRSHSGLTVDGKTLVLPTHSNSCTFQSPEEILFAYNASLFAEQLDCCGTSPPKDVYTRSAPQPAIGFGNSNNSNNNNNNTVSTGFVKTDSVSTNMTIQSQTPPAVNTSYDVLSGTCVTVGYIQLRNSLLFALQAVNPLPGTDDNTEQTTSLPQSAESVSTGMVLRRRWQFQHPSVNQAEASWDLLCSFRILPLYGSKAVYPRDAFYTASPHQYAIGRDERRTILEFILQRLQQQYQIVVETYGPHHAAYPLQWPRADPTANARLEMSIGHQVHTLKIGETAKSLSITRMLHRGMYSNGQVTHMLSYRYALWNYLDNTFDQREVHMEAQVGEKIAYCWEALDRWVQDRPSVFIPRGPDLWLRSREVAVALLPENPAQPPSFEEFRQFIGCRFSVHLTTRGKAEWTYDDRPLSIDVPAPTPEVFPDPPAMVFVVLVHDNPRTLETRNIMEHATGRTTAYEQAVDERLLLVDIVLPPQYHPGCHYLLKVSWLACQTPIITDWLGSFIANASRHRFRAVPISCYYQNPKSESLSVHSDVVVRSRDERDEPLLRRHLLRLLTLPENQYYPDTAVMNRNCRLVHLSGLCYVVIPPDARVVAQWYQNDAFQQGTLAQKQLFERYRVIVSQARAAAQAERTSSVTEPSN